MTWWWFEVSWVANSYFLFFLMEVSLRLSCFFSFPFIVLLYHLWATTTIHRYHHHITIASLCISVWGYEHHALSLCACKCGGGEGMEKKKAADLLSLNIPSLFQQQVFTSIHFQFSWIPRTNMNAYLKMHAHHFSLVWFGFSSSSGRRSLFSPFLRLMMTYWLCFTLDLLCCRNIFFLDICCPLLFQTMCVFEIDVEHNAWGFSGGYEKKSIAAITVYICKSNVHFITFTIVQEHRQNK